jgi:hypothetical protein
MSDYNTDLDVRLWTQALDVMRRWPRTFTCFVRRILRNSTTEYNLSTTLYGSCKLADACIYWHTIRILCHLELMATVNQNFHHKVYCLPLQEATVVIIYLQSQIQLCFSPFLLVYQLKSLLLNQRHSRMSSSLVSLGLSAGNCSL